MNHNRPRGRSLFVFLLAAGILGAASNASATPAFSSYSILGISSITVAWTAGTGSGGDTYQAILSTDPSPSSNGDAGNQTASGAGLLSQTFTSLSANTTYYVDAIDQTTDVSYTSFPGTSTLADVPTPNGPLTAGSNTIVPLWSPATNPTWTVYDCQISTDPLFSVFAQESVTLSQNPTFSGLTPNTQYYTRIEALNNDGVPSVGGFVSLPNTYTTPASLVQGFNSVGATFASLVWGNGGNPAGTTYQPVVSSSTPPIDWTAAANSSLRTTNLYQTFSGMLPNTQYEGGVAAVPNGGGTPSYDDLGSTWTLANAPVSDFTSVHMSTYGPIIDAHWSSNGNPNPGTSYNVQVSTSPSFYPLLTLVGNPVSDIFVSISGLATVTTYYIEVQAINGAGVATSFVSLPTIETLTNQPGVGAPPYTAIGTATVQANWTANGNSASNTYTAVLSTGALPNAFAGNQSTTTANLFEAFGGLAPNATYYVEVSSALVGGVYAQLGATVTWAAPPSTVSIAATSPTSILASWTSSDPAGTLFQLQASSNSAFDSTLSLVLGTTTTASTATISGLAVQTTYYLQVQAINFSGVATAFVPFGGSVPTWPDSPPGVPVLSSAALGASSVTWTWSAVSLASGYQVLDSTGGFLSGGLPASSSSWTDTGLSTNTSYTRRLAAFNGVGASTSAPLAAVTLAAEPSASSITADGLESIVFSWSAEDPAPRTRYVAEMWEQTGATVTANTAETSARFSVVRGSTYYLDVYALNSAGVATPRAASTSTFLALIDADVETIEPDTGGSLHVYTSSGPVTVYFPPATFTVPVTATLNGLGVLPHALSDAAPMTETGVGSVVSVAPDLQPGRPVSITIGYPAARMTGFSAARLELAYYDPLENLWVPLQASASNAQSKQVAGQSRRLSAFQIMAVAPASNLAAAKVYPNPFRPALGHAVITFAQLPAGAGVKIYTVTGELVRSLSADGSGIAHWDATNSDGRSVASGGYFALVEGAGDKTVLKLVIQR